MTAEDFVALLDGVKRSSRGWIARCPSHRPDHCPSLSIAAGQDGRILIHCFSGCTDRDICAALGLTPRDLFPDDTSRHAVDRARRKRETKLATEQRKRQREGGRIDRLREAENLIRSARNIDISTWSSAKLDQELNRLADAYDIRGREGPLYESC